MATITSLIKILEKILKTDGDLVIGCTISSKIDSGEIMDVPASHLATTNTYINDKKLLVLRCTEDAYEWDEDSWKIEN
jgi:hypothetical protein